jgi:zinc protease
MIWTPTRESNGIYEFKHSTGLTLLLVPRDGLEVTTANITYHVGSRNEGLGVRGGTHMLEHWMFKGSKNFNKANKNSMWKLEALGAYMNATTYMDRTNYFSCIDSSKLASEVIPREADRMKAPLLDSAELRKEMTVVRNEFERGNNNDFEVLQKRVVAMAFIAHPYHHSTIGWKSEIEGVIETDALKTFHDTYYKPSNATYTFVGNFNSEEIMKSVDEEFGSRYDDYDQSIPTMYTTEPPQMGQRRTIISRPTSCALMCIAFKAPNGMHEDSIVLEVISHLISHGPSALSEKYKRDTKTSVHNIQAEWERMRDPYLFTIWGTTDRPDSDALHETEEAINHITDRLTKESFDKEIERAKTSIRHQWENEMMGTRNMASAVNEAIARGDAFDVYNRFNILETVDSASVKRVATDIFNYDRSSVGWLLPGSLPKEIIVSNYEPLKGKAFTMDDLPQQHEFEYNISGDEWTEYNSDKTDIRMSLQYGDNSLPSYVNRDILAELMTKGFKIKRRTCAEKELYEFLSVRNINRSVSTGPDGIHIMASIPNDEKTLLTGVNFMQHEINTPLLEESSFQYLRKKWLAELNGLKNNVNHVAKNVFAQCLFQEGDPNYRYSFDKVIEQVRRVSYNDIVTEHANLMKAARLVTTVSPTNNIVLKNVGKYNLEYDQNIRDKAHSKDVIIPGKSSVVVKYGMVLPDASDELRIAVAVLGGGFTGRLMSIVRDQYGLTYGINARLKHGKGCAIFEVSGTFSPVMLQEGLKRTDEVIKQWISDELTAEEIDIQKIEMKGSRNVQYDAPGALASAIHQNKIVYGNVDRMNNFDNLVDAITVEAVNESKRAISFDKLGLIKVGTI